jgi:hypothetical protein
MIEDHEIKDVLVERRDGTLVTRNSGYVTNVQVVRDVTAEHRMELFQIHRVLWGMLVFLEILLTFRFVLRLIAANPDSGFAMLVYGVTGLFVGPFNGLIATPTFGGLSLEVTTLIAMGVYAMLFWGIATLIRFVTERPRVSAFSDSDSL